MNLTVWLKGERLGSFAVFAYDKDPVTNKMCAECVSYVDNKLLPRGTIKRLKDGEVIKAELKFSAWKCTILQEGGEGC